MLEKNETTFEPGADFCPAGYNYSPYVESQDESELPRQPWMIKIEPWPPSRTLSLLCAFNVQRCMGDKSTTWNYGEVLHFIMMPCTFLPSFDFDRVITLVSHPNHVIKWRQWKCIAQCYPAFAAGWSLSLSCSCWKSVKSLISAVEVQQGGILILYESSN